MKDTFIETMSLMKDAVKICGKYMTSKEGVKQIRDSAALSVAGYVVGKMTREAITKRFPGGWYARYINKPSVQKAAAFDDKVAFISAAVATALDLVITLDQTGVLNLPSLEEAIGYNEDPRDDVEDCKEAILKHVDVSTSTDNGSEKAVETVPPSRDDIDDDEDEDALY